MNKERRPKIIFPGLRNGSLDMPDDIEDIRLATVEGVIDIPPRDRYTNLTISFRDNRDDFKDNEDMVIHFGDHGTVETVNDLGEPVTYWLVYLSEAYASIFIKYGALVISDSSRVYTNFGIYILKYSDDFQKVFQDKYSHLLVIDITK